MWYKQTATMASSRLLYVRVNSQGFQPITGSTIYFNILGADIASSLPVEFVIWTARCLP